MKGKEARFFLGGSRPAPVSKPGISRWGTVLGMYLRHPSCRYIFHLAEIDEPTEGDPLNNRPHPTSHTHTSRMYQQQRYHHAWQPHHQRPHRFLAGIWRQMTAVDATLAVTTTYHILSWQRNPPFRRKVLLIPRATKKITGLMRFLYRHRSSLISITGYPFIKMHLCKLDLLLKKRLRILLEHRNLEKYDQPLEILRRWGFNIQDPGPEDFHGPWTKQRRRGQPSSSSWKKKLKMPPRTLQGCRSWYPLCPSFGSHPSPTS